MPITPADLTYPPGGTGEIRPDWFPGEVLSDVLAVWIAQGYSTAASEGVSGEADANAVTTAFAYREAYRAVAARLAGTASSLSLEDMSQGIAKDRHEFFTSRAADWDALLRTAISEGQEEVETISSPPLASRAMTNSFVF